MAWASSEASSFSTGSRPSSGSSGALIRINPGVSSPRFQVPASPIFFNAGAGTHALAKDVFGGVSVLPDWIEPPHDALTPMATVLIAEDDVLIRDLTQA